MSALGEQFMSMARWMRWAFAAVVLISLFFVWEKTAGAVASTWNADADRLEARLKVVNEGDRLTQKVRRLDDAVVGLGAISTPVSDVEGQAMLTAAVNSILQSFNITKDSFDVSGSGERLSQAVTQKITKRGQRIERLNGNFKFESSPKDAIAIIAKFEQEPGISIGSVRMTKGDGRGGEKVVVHLTIETWVAVADRRRAR